MRGSTAGLPEPLTGENAFRYRVLTILDALFSALVIAPIVVGYWRSVWELMALYVYPEDQLLSNSISTVVGVVGHMAFGFGQTWFERWLHPERQGAVLFFFLSRTYTVLYAFICVNGWRGPWQLLDMYTNNDVFTIGSLFVVGLVGLIILRALRNCSATPFSVVIDSVKGYFEVPTMFRVPMAEKAYLYILDCLFSVFVIGTLVVFVWRGAWALLDIYLFPENEVMSAWASLGIGYAAVATAFLLQPAMKWICDRLTGGSRLLVADLFLIFSLIGTVNVWRGIWNLLNLYLMPDNLELSCWITHWVCLLVLVLLGCSNSLLVRGVYIDAEEPAGKCVVFPCYYLRLIFQNQQKLKIKQPEPEKGIKTELASIKSIENNHIIEPLEILNHKTEV